VCEWAGGIADAKSTTIVRRSSSPKLVSGRGRMASKIVILQFNDVVGTSVSPFYFPYFFTDGKQFEGSVGVTLRPCTSAV
jgi:hypothetical protein